VSLLKIQVKHRCSSGTYARFTRGATGPTSHPHIEIRVFDLVYSEFPVKPIDVVIFNRSVSDLNIVRGDIIAQLFLESESEN
jgi:hypothetical protein